MFRPEAEIARQRTEDRIREADRWRRGRRGERRTPRPRRGEA
jgi:hypothetical protein